MTSLYLHNVNRTYNSMIFCVCLLQANSWYLLMLTQTNSWSLRKCLFIVDTLIIHQLIDFTEPATTGRKKCFWISQTGQILEFAWSHALVNDHMRRNPVVVQQTTLQGFKAMSNFSKNAPRGSQEPCVILQFFRWPIISINYSPHVHSIYSIHISEASPTSIFRRLFCNRIPCKALQGNTF